MRALVWTAPKQMEMQEAPIPVPQADEVVVHVAYAGICGSELSGYLGHNALRVPPLIMGHEFAGTITEVGHNVTAVQVGQQVTVNPLYCTEPSEFQARGLDQLCPSRRLIGAHQAGAFAEYVAVPVQTVLPLPGSLSLRIGALAEPVGVAVRIAEQAGDVTDQDCLVIGAGPIGLLALQMLNLNGAKRVFIADIDPERLQMGEQFGGITIDPKVDDVVKQVKQATDNRGVVAAVDAVGLAVTRQQCVSATVPTGTVVLSGLHEETSAMPAADIIRREIVVKGAFAYSPANFKTAVDLLADDKIGLGQWIVDAPLAEGGQWFERLIESPGAVAKVLLLPGD